MAIIDKSQRLAAIPTTTGAVQLEFGCGPRKRLSTAIGVDVLDYDCVDVVGDALEVLAAIPAGSVDSIASYHFLEHVADLTSVLTEFGRVLKDNGALEIVVPHFSNPYYYSDPTHRTLFGLYTMSYFANDSLFRRRVPCYGAHKVFNLCSARLVFKSSRPFYIRYAVRHLFGLAVNMLNCTKEFYEDCLCWLVPCYEVRYQLRKGGNPWSRSEFL